MRNTIAFLGLVIFSMTFLGSLYLAAKPSSMCHITETYQYLIDAFVGAIGIGCAVFALKDGDNDD